MPEYLQLDFRPNDAWWIAQLQSKAAASESQGIRARYQMWADSGLGALALALATKLTIRGRVASRFLSLQRQLHQEVEGFEGLEVLLDGGYVFSPSDPSLLYDLCDAVDSIYFESRSAYEITKVFVEQFCDIILERSITKEDLYEVLEHAGQETKWIDDLTDNRNLFLHETAPWIALRVDCRSPLQVRLIIMKENLHSFDDPDKFITEEELIATWNGYSDAMLAIKEWLEEQLELAE